MNKTKLSSIWIILILAALLLGACTPASPTANPVAPTQPQDQPATADTQAPAAAPTQPSAEQPSGERVTLNLISNWDAGSDPKGKVLQTIAQDFMAANPDVEIKIEIVPDTDMATKVETSFLAQQEPDIILHNWLGPSKDWLADGVVVPLTPYIKEWGLEGKFKESALSDFSVDGELAALPIEGFNWPIWYNMDILEKAGVAAIPTTWDELTDAAQKIRAAGFQPFVIGGKDWTGGDWFLTVITAALGNEQAADLFANGGFSQNADAKAFVEAFVKMRDAGVFADNVEGLEFESMNAMFFEGKAGMVHGGSWSYAELPKELDGKVQLGGIPLPPNAKGATKPFWYSSFEAKGFWVTRNGSAKLDTIQKFAQFFFQDKYMASFVEQTAMVHPFTNLEYDASVLSPLFVQSLALDVDTVEHASVAWAPTNVFDAWYDVTANAFVPGTSAEDILKAMDDLYQ